jgi:hypothetical protein
LPLACRRKFVRYHMHQQTRPRRFILVTMGLDDSVGAYLVSAVSAIQASGPELACSNIDALIPSHPKTKLFSEKRPKMSEKARAFIH